MKEYLTHVPGADLVPQVRRYSDATGGGETVAQRAARRARGIISMVELRPLWAARRGVAPPPTEGIGHRLDPKSGHVIIQDLEYKTPGGERAHDVHPD